MRATCQEMAVVDSGNRKATGWLWGAFVTAHERAETDADLLSRFIRTRDEVAFRELVRRLGPTVYGVCCRHLGNTADADDAFQTTFVVLSRKAGTVRPPGRVAAWVYGVASLAARKLRQSRQRRLLREVVVSHLPDRPAPEREMDADLPSAVDEELARLPDKYRLPIVLCGLRGLTIAQAAAELGWPAGTLATRLGRGRVALGQRLAKRGITLAVGAGMGALPELTASVPSKLIEQTVAATTGGTLSTAVAALTSEVMNTMTWTPMRRISVGLLVVTAVVATGGAIFTNDVVAQAAKAPTPADAKPAVDRVEWDKVSGLLRQESVRQAIRLSDDDFKTLIDFRKDRRATLKKKLETDLNGGVPPVPGAAQKAAAVGNNRQMAAQAEAFHQYQSALRELEMELAAKATESLKPAGVRRLKQAILQAAGPRGLLDRVAIRELQLTAEQEDKIATAIGPGRSHTTILASARLVKAAEEQDAAMTAALKVLTADQKKRWEALVGEALPTVDLLRAGPTSEESLNADLNQ